MKDHMLKGIDWPLVVEKIKNFATSEYAQNLLDNISPLEKPKEALKSFSQITEAQNLLQTGQRPFMESLDLFSNWSHRLKKESILSTRELKDVHYFCIESLALKEFLEPHSGHWTDEIKLQLFTPEETLLKIEKIILPDGSIRNDASEKLYKLFQEQKNLSASIRKSLDRIVKDNELDTVLQDRYVTNREGRWVLPVKSGMQHSFSGIIHASSHTKETVFMEPQEIVPVNNRLREVGSEIESEIEQLLTQLSHYLHTKKEQLFTSHSALVECDCTFAKAQWSTLTNAAPVEFCKDNITLKQLTNPLLVVSGEKAIPNNLELNPEKRILLLSGPNAGGKTVLLKSLGLAAHMARCGLHVCASNDSKLPFFKKLLVAVGDSQNIDEHLSTFAAHLKTLSESLKYSGPDSLLLIDEICSSTDPEEGSALARSFIHSYSENQIFGLITSHFGNLKLNWDDKSAVANGSLEFDLNKGPTYEFFMGVPGQSLAIQTAERVGISEKIINRALEFLSPEQRDFQKGVKKLDEVKAQLQAAKESFIEQQKEAALSRKKYDKLQQDFKKERDELLRRSLIKAERSVEKEIKLAKADQVFKKHTELQKIKSELPQIIKHQKTSIRQITSPEDFTKYYPPGSPIFVTSLNQDGVIQSEPNNKGEVQVLSNSMRLSINWKDLKPSQNQTNPTRNILKQRTQFSFSPNDELRVIDLRGQSVDDAIAEIEIQFDKATLAQEDRVKIVHGHGTDTLKNRVRSYLTRCTYVKKWQAGSSKNGGDGVTWVEIND